VDVYLCPEYLDIKTSNVLFKGAQASRTFCSGKGRVEENIVKWVTGQRISWLGHLERVEEDRMPKMNE